MMELTDTHKDTIICTLEGITMRTNIVLDDDLIQRALALTGLKTKKDVVHEALLTLVRPREQEQTKDLRGKLNWTGNMDELRQGRGHDLG
jgi:Arc/MetJ family transcription regulator